MTAFRAACAGLAGFSFEIRFERVETKPCFFSSSAEVVLALYCIIVAFCYADMVYFYGLASCYELCFFC